MEQRTIQHAGFLLLLALVTIAFGALIADFLQPLLWAAIFAILFYPVQARVVAATGGRRTLAALLTASSVVLLVFLPLALIGVAVSTEAIGLYERVTRGEIDVPGAIAQWEPLVLELGARLGVEPESIRGGAADGVAAAAQFVASQTLVFGQNAVRVGGQTALMLYVLFFFLRDGDAILRSVGRALPLGDARERSLFARFTAVTRATLKGTLVVGAVQGLLGGLLFWILGLSAPVFWGVTMAVFSLLPVVGPAAVWGPAAIVLIATGSVAKGVVLLAAGALVIGLVDNLLRPILVGRQASLPDYVVLLATLGGLSLFGLLGFVAGPVLAALFLSVWDMFAAEYSSEDRAGGLV